MSSDREPSAPVKEPTGRKPFFSSGSAPRQPLRIVARGVRTRRRRRFVVEPPGAPGYSKNFRLQPVSVEAPGTLARRYVVLPHQVNEPVYQYRFSQA
jgi:hypothetical protein